ncbi:MAG: ABC transporter permease [Firmicutes bacterium]|nr:ABC transporter permease [Bacillota bacterium]
MTSWLQDFRLALRNLRRLPQFTLPTLLVLALGLGATAAVVGTLRSVFFTPPPYEHSEKIHYLWWTDRDKDSHFPASWPLYQELKTRLKGVSAVEGFNYQDMNLSGDGEPEILKVGKVTPNFFTQIFRTRPLLGSLQWNPDHPEGVVLTESLWRNRYGADRAMVGRLVQINGVSHPVLGVLPGKAQLRGAKAFIPLIPEANMKEGRYHRFMMTYVRLAPQTSDAQFKSELDALTKAFESEHPGTIEATTKLVSRSLMESQKKNYRDLGQILVWAAGLLVLITLVNVANAVLARAVAGSQDTALRTALGASRLQAIRPRLAEALLLCVGGLLLGLVVAQISLVLLRPMVSLSIQAVRPLTLDLSLLGWMALAALIVALLLGGLPGLLMDRFRLSVLMGGTKGMVRSGSRRLRTAMAVVQISLAVTLLASFASLSAVLLKLNRTPLGIQTEGVAVFTCDTSTKTPEAGKEADLRAMTVLERLRGLPGVAQAGTIAMLPVEDYGWNYGSETHERPNRDGEWVEMRTASPGLFDAFGIKLLSGRNFTDADMTSGEPIAIISQALARTFWEGKDPLGQEFKRGDQWIRVVGVVSDVRNAGPASDFAQMVSYFPSPTGMQSTTFVVRYANPKLVDLPSLRKVVRETAPQWPIKGLRPMDQVVSESIKDTTSQVKLLGFAGALALLLSLAGLYNLLAYLVAQRTPEFGLRTALGATPGQLLTLVLKSGLWMGGLGVGVGLFGAYAAGRFLQSTFADAEPSKPISLLFAALTMLLGSVLAGLLPAIRAARVEPATALRAE